MNNIIKKLTCLFFIVLLCVCGEAQNITGTWSGTLHVPTNEFPIVFHIGKDGAGKLIASFDSPAQNAFGLAVSEVIAKDDSVILMMAVLNGKYAGVLGQDKKTINGTWFQAMAALPLIVSKTSDTTTVKQQKRPQTPKPPFAYQTKDIEYWNADKSIHFGGTLTYPGPEMERPKNGFPAVLLITGSGQQDRDETLVGHKPFAVIADNLTKKGFVVLRVDDRGMGKTTGDFSQSTSMDFAKDAAAGLDFLETQTEVNKEKIGLIGHSEGGLIAPIVAGERRDVKFIVLLAGPGIPTIDLMQQQSEAVDVSAGRSPAEAAATASFLRIVWAESIKNEDSATAFINIKTRVDAFTKTLDTATLAKMRNRIAVPVDDYIRKVMAAASSKWFHYFIGFDPRPYLQKLQCKVLAIGGSKDIQVIAKTNLEGIRLALKKSRSPKYDVIELPGLNHLFQDCTRCSVDEYGDLEETFSPAALTVMDDWLLKNIR